MRDVISRWLLPAAAALVAGQTGAQVAAPLVISTGEQGGGYWSAGERLKAVATDFDLAVTNEPSTGSLENIERMLDMQSPVGLAFAQGDALQYYLSGNPEAAQSLEVRENIGQECVFMLSGVDSGIKSLDDLQRKAKDISLGIKSETSGIAVTYKYMSTLVPELGSVNVIYGDTESALATLGEDGAELDVVMVVHRPKEHSPEVDAAVANPERVHFVELEDDDLTDKLPNGEVVYRNMRLALPGVKDTVSTICVPGLLLSHKTKLSLDEHDRLTRLVSYAWMKVYVTP